MGSGVGSKLRDLWTESVREREKEEVRAREGERARAGKKNGEIEREEMCGRVSIHVYHCVGD